MGEDLIEVLQQQIRSKNKGYLTFAEYMEQCLYHPHFGYYMKPRVKIGRKGDFYTSSSVHSVFAETFVDVVVEASHKTDFRVSVLEFGAGTGQFAQQFLDDLKQRYEHLYHNCCYLILEKSPDHVQQQKDKLNEHHQYVEWLSELTECRGFKGIVLANELFDAFPVHIVEMSEGKLQEIGVTWSDEEDSFIEICFPPTDHVQKYISTNDIQLQETQRLEIPCSASAWIREAAALITDGLWLIIDYGYTYDELSLPYHRQGTLLCYDQHSVDENPLVRPGHKDITYHVHFDALSQDASQAGWRKRGLFAQHDFLLQAGIVYKLTNHQGGDPFAQEEMRRNRAIRQFISPEGISGAFKVLVMAKGVFNLDYSFLEPFSFQDIVQNK